MIAEIFAAAVFGTTMYLKAKSKVPKDVREDWNNLDAIEKTEHLADGFCSYSEERVEEVKKNYKK